MKQHSNSGFYAFITVLIVAASLVYVWKFLLPSYQTSKSQLDSLDTEINSLETKLNSIKSAKTSLDQLGVTKDQILLAIPEGKDAPNLITELEAIAGAEKMVIPTIQLSNPSTQATNSVKYGSANPLNISLSLDGTFDNFSALISSIEKDIRFMNIKTLNMTSTEDSDGKSKLNLAIEIETYLRGTPSTATTSTQSQATQAIPISAEDNL